MRTGMPASQHASILASATEGLRLLRLAQWVCWRRVMGRHRGQVFPYTDSFYALPAHIRLLEAFDPTRAAELPVLAEGFEEALAPGRWEASSQDAASSTAVTAQTVRTARHAGKRSLAVRSWA